MKKLLSLIMASLLTVITFAGCGADENPSSETNTSSETVTTSEASSETVTTSKATSTSSKKGSSSSKKDKTSKVKSSSEKEVVYTEKEKIYYGLDPELYELSLKNKGNSARIANLMKKAQKGGSYKIAVLGGSISEGAKTTSEYLCYGNLVCEWWRASFPNASFEFINAGIGSTNPEMACYRIEKDLLDFNPDFVVVDFTVNTYLDNNLNHTYSTILYKILSQKNNPAVMSIDFTHCNNSKYSGGIREKTTNVPNAEIDAAIKSYDIPAVSYHNYIWEKLKDSSLGLKWDHIAADYIHPNDNGHRIAANVITCYLEKVLENLSKESTKITAPKKPVVDDYLNLGYVTNTTKSTFNGGFNQNPNTKARARGWWYSATLEASSLTVEKIPANKKVKVFIGFNNTGSSGSITVTDGKTTQIIKAGQCQTPTLVDIGKIEGNITFTPSAGCDDFTIFGIGYEK